MASGQRRSRVRTKRMRQVAKEVPLFVIRATPRKSWLRSRASAVAAPVGNFRTGSRVINASSGQKRRNLLRRIQSSRRDFNSTGRILADGPGNRNRSSLAGTRHQSPEDCLFPEFGTVPGECNCRMPGLLAPATGSVSLGGADESRSINCTSTELCMVTSSPLSFPKM